MSEPQFKSGDKVRFRGGITLFTVESVHIDSAGEGVHKYFLNSASGSLGAWENEVESAYEKQPTSSPSLSEAMPETEETEAEMPLIILEPFTKGDWISYPGSVQWDEEHPPMISTWKEHDYEIGLVVDAIGLEITLLNKNLVHDTYHSYHQVKTYHSYYQVKGGDIFDQPQMWTFDEAMEVMKKCKSAIDVFFLMEMEVS